MTISEQAKNFKDWFRAYHDENYTTWFDTQSRGIIEAEILEYLEGNVENTYNQNKKLAKRIHQELWRDR